MNAYHNLAGVIAKIEAQQKGKEETPAFNIGEQLKEIARAEPAAAEILDQDLEKEGMGLEGVADAFEDYADEQFEKQKKSSCICITPIVADGLIREFYGLAKREEPAKQEEIALDAPADQIDLSAFI